MEQTFQSEAHEEFDRFLSITQRLFRSRAKELQLKDGGDLIGSLRTYMSKVTPDTMIGILEQLPQGRFRDMGHREIKKDRRELKTTRRELADMKKRRKLQNRWYSRLIFARLNDLQGIMGRVVIEEARLISKGLPKTV